MKYIKPFGVIILLVVISNFVNAEIYKWIDDNGKVHFSDKPPISENAETVDEQLLASRTSSYTGVSIDLVRTAVTGKVIIYTTTRCGYCLKAKKYFVENKIPYNEKNIEISKKYNREFKKLGGKGVPVILWKKNKMRGFSAERFEKMYKS